jgi:hypothetical protein
MRGSPTAPSSEGALEIANADAARGTLRDGLGGLRNLVQLLHSLRVAPKSVAQVLPDVYAALGPMREAQGALLASLSEALEDDAAVRELNAYFVPRFDELDKAINEAMRQSMSARIRIRLEQTTTLLSRELDTARGLLDLLTEARVGRRPALDPLEIIKQGCAPSSTSNPADPTRSAYLTSDAGPFELAVNPRVLIGLVGLGVELVTAGENARPTVNVTRGAADTCSITVFIPSTPSNSGEELSLAASGLIAPTLTCAKAAAELSDASVIFEPEARKFTLTLRGSDAKT